jgi:hypothetical protein
MSTSTLDSLPAEVLLEIVTHVPVCAEQLRLVSKALRKNVEKAKKIDVAVIARPGVRFHTYIHTYTL